MLAEALPCFGIGDTGAVRQPQRGRLPRHAQTTTAWMGGCKKFKNEGRRGKTKLKFSPPDRADYAGAHKEQSHPSSPSSPHSCSQGRRHHCGRSVALGSGTQGGLVNWDHNPGAVQQGGTTWVPPAKTSGSSRGEWESRRAQPRPAANSPPLPEGVKTAAARTTYWSWQTRSKGNSLFMLIWVIKHPQNKQVRCRGAIWGLGVLCWHCWVLSPSLPGGGRTPGAPPTFEQHPTTARNRGVPQYW